MKVGTLRFEPNELIIEIIPINHIFVKKKIGINR